MARHLDSRGVLTVVKQRMLVKRGDDVHMKEYIFVMCTHAQHRQEWHVREDMRKVCTNTDTYTCLEAGSAGYYPSTMQATTVLCHDIGMTSWHWNNVCSQYINHGCHR